MNWLGLVRKFVIEASFEIFYYMYRIVSVDDLLIIELTELK